MYDSRYLEFWGFRKLEVGLRVLLPEKTMVRLLTTSSDVIHSWAVPSLGVKIDSCPGRLNQVFFDTHRIGTFYGQCSELCGANHAYMPIVVNVYPPEQWLREIFKYRELSKLI